jgi:Flp pilus assembly protein TadD
MTWRANLLAGALLAAAAATGCASAGASSATAAPQIDFGIDMARRGLWNEALFRFEQARRERPADAKVLNNLAVAYEAVGRFDDALAAYKQAVQLAPGERGLKANYSRFLEFYQSYRPQKPGETPPKSEEAKP